MQAFATRFEDSNIPSKKQKWSGFDSEMRSLPKNHKDGTYLIWNGEKYEQGLILSSENKQLLLENRLSSQDLEQIVQITAETMEKFYNPNPWRPGKWTTVVAWTLALLALAGWIVYLALGSLGASASNVIVSVVIAILIAVVLTLTFKAIFRGFWRSRKQARLIKSELAMQRINQLLATKRVPVTARMSLHGAYIALEYDSCKGFYARPTVPSFDQI